MANDGVALAADPECWTDMRDDPGAMMRAITGTTVTSQRTSEPIRAGWGQYVVVLAVLATIFVVATIVLWPLPYAFAVEHFVLPEYHAAFGFRGGSVPVAGATSYAIVEVTPGGALHRAGVRSGDMPVEYHGGLWAFYGALQAAAAGQPAEFMVIAKGDWGQWDKRRRIALPPQP